MMLKAFPVVAAGHDEPRRLQLKSYRRFDRDVTCNHHQASTIPRLSSALRALVGALNALHILHSEHD